jgi:ATP phosphoribosyltransferase
LRENRLRVAGVLGSSTARLVANQASLKTRTEAVQAMVGRLREAAFTGSPRIRGETSESVGI